MWNLWIGSLVFQPKSRTHSKFHYIYSAWATIIKINGIFNLISTNVGNLLLMAHSFVGEHIEYHYTWVWALGWLESLQACEIDWFKWMMFFRFYRELTNLKKPDATDYVSDGTLFWFIFFFSQLYLILLTDMWNLMILDHINKSRSIQKCLWS